MCGICGSAGFADREQLEAMNAIIIHRGPDDGGVQLFPDGSGTPYIGLGNRRLSIIDLSPAGHQPMCNEDETVWIAYNGEVFNFLELKPELEAKGHVFRSHADTEVLVHLYEERGIDFLNELNGMFGLALWDSRKETLFLARDQFGIKPVYYMPLPGGRLAFASEVKSFIAGGFLTPEVDSEALHYFLNFLWVPGPKTLFRGVFKLMPGYYLRWHKGEFVTCRYWQGQPTSVQRNRSEAELITELRQELRAAVKRHLISDVPLGVFLSGGLDSSTLLALSTEITNRPMKAYTIGFRSNDARYEQSDEDQKYARVVAQAFGADHHEIEVDPDITQLLPKICWHLDEPVADPAAITSYLICNAAHKELTVLLSGQGGDEIFGGYRVHLMDGFSQPLAMLPSAVRERALLPMWDILPRISDHVPGVRPGKVLAYHRYFRKAIVGAKYPATQRYVYHRSYYTPGEQATLYSPDFRSQVAGFDPYATHLAYFDQVEGASFIDRMLYVDQKTFLPELNLTYSDKTSMAASVEARVPLLDQKLAAFMRSVPPEFKIRRTTQKYLLKRAMEGILPHDVIWRGKAGFGAPIRKWLRHDLSTLVDDVLSHTSIRRRGYFDPRAIDRLLAEDRSGKADNTYRIWALLTFEIWQRIFIDGQYNP